MKLLRNISLDFRRNKVIYFLCVPIVAWYIIFHYIPMGGIVISFQDYTPALGLTGSPWIGLDNFTRFFGGEYAFRLIRNTFMLSLLDLIFNFPAPILFALLLNEIHSRAFRRTIQTISYMPYFVSMVVMCGIIVDFTQSGGLISEAVALITGGRAQNLLGNKDYFRTIYTVSSIWQGLGYGSIIYLAALSGVNQDLYEAARIDGASEFRILAGIVIPMAAPILATLCLLVGLAYWNDWQNGLYYLTDNKLFSIQVLLQNIQRSLDALKQSAQAGGSVNVSTADLPSNSVRMAITVMGVLPIMIVYPFLQRFFVKGIAIGAVKG